MSNLSLVIVAALLLATAVWWARRRSHLLGDRVSTARNAVQACNTLLALVAHIQQHRGMSTAWLAGDKSFERRLIVKRGEIEPLIAKLQQVAAEENAHSYPCFTPNDVSLWRHRWGTLLGELAGSSVEKSIAAHSNLIATLLTWLNVLGEARIELPLGAVLPEGTVRNFSHRLPQLSETLGQARATGSGVAALGACPAVARVRLMFLVSRAESLIDQACAVDRRGQAAERLVKGLALTTRTHMLAKSRIEISAEDYFAEATRAIDAVFGWINDCGHVLQAEIDRAADRQARGPQLRLQGGK